MKIFSIFLLFFPFVLKAHDAIVFGGPGACSDGCVDAAVEVTRLAGFDPLVVTPETFEPDQLRSARVWVQPGGKSTTAAKAMGSKMMNDIRVFIEAGGGYVGFCAGAFLSTSRIGTSFTRGLGIVPGRTALFRGSRKNISVQPMVMGGETRHLYWEGGPYLSFSQSELAQVEVLMKYANGGQIGGVRTKFGQGRVAVTGLHPEAPQWWYDSARISDSDGLDNELAADMIKWAAN